MRRPSVVLDTNVIVSAHLKQDGLERFVLDLALSRALTMYASEEVLAEYSDVLRRSRLGISPALVKRSLELIRNAATIVRPKRVADLPFDPDDNKFLDCATAAQAHFLVTGNKRHFPRTWQETRIVSARESLQELVPTMSR